MEAILTNVGSFFESVLGWIPDVVQLIVDNPLLTIFCIGLPVGGFVVGLLNRVKRV